MAKPLQDDSKQSECDVSITSELEPTSAVTVHFSNTTVTVARNKLSPLGFFAAGLAKRWSSNDSNHQSDKCHHVYISRNGSVGYGDEKKDNTESKHTVDGDTILELGFEACDLELLVECVELGQISPKLKSNCVSIERLIACSDYFTSKEDKFRINKDNLLHYLKNRVPRISYKERMQLEKEATSDVLKCALTEWNTELQTIIQQYRKDLISNSSKIKADNIFLDHESANKLFVATFKPKIIPYTFSKKFDLSIENFKGTNYDMILRLWKQCSYDENYSIISMVPDIVNTMAKHSYRNFNAIEYEDEEQYKVMKDILHRVVKDAGLGKIDPGKIGLDMYSMVVYLDLKLMYDAGWYWCDPCSRFEPNLKYFSLDNMKEFLSIILDNYVKYSKSCVTETSMTQKEKKEAEDAKEATLKKWYELIQICITKCDGQHIVNIANQWFPVLTGEGRNAHETKIKEANVDWIFDVLVPTFGGHSAYQFAIYLAKYIVIDRNHKDSDVPTKIFDFVENETGFKYKVKTHKK